MVAHTFGLSPREAEAGRALESGASHCVPWNSEFPGSQERKEILKPRMYHMSSSTRAESTELAKGQGLMAKPPLLLPICWSLRHRSRHWRCLLSHLLPNLVWGLLKKKSKLPLFLLLYEVVTPVTWAHCLPQGTVSQVIKAQRRYSFRSHSIWWQGWGKWGLALTTKWPLFRTELCCLQAGWTLSSGAAWLLVSSIWVPAETAFLGPYIPQVFLI